MTTTRPIPTSQNDAWGFTGTMDEHAQVAWTIAMIAISDATGQPLESVRAFLDTEWQSHTVRGFFAGALKKKLGLNITSFKDTGASRVYRLDQETVKC